MQFVVDANILFAALIKDSITIEILVEEFLDFAEKIAPHAKDAPYLALALKLKIPVWSNDRNLKEKKYVKVYNTREILELGLL